MADEKQARETEQEQEPEQVPGEEPEQEPAEPPKDKPAKKKSGGGIILPILYALLAAVGAFTLVMIAGIVWSILAPSSGPLASPSSEPSVQIIQTQAPESESPDSDTAE